GDCSPGRGRVGTGGGDGRGWTANTVGLAGVWDLATRRPLGTVAVPPGQAVTAAAFVDGGRHLVTACLDPGSSPSLQTPYGRGQVRVCDAATGDPVRDLPGPTMGFEHVAVSPDGRRVAALTRYGTRVTVWDAA